MTARAVATLLSSAALSVAALAAAPSWPSGLQAAEDDARRDAVEAVASGSVNWWPVRDAFRAADAAGRTRLVEALLAWAKAYAATPAFAAAYAERRLAARPEPPETKGSVDQELAAQQAEQRRAIAEMKALLPKMPADQRAALKESIAQMEAMVAEQAQDASLQGMLREGMAAERAESERAYREALAAWERDHPVDPRRALARRLRAFLAVCAEVDHAAKLVRDPATGKMRFVDPALEARSAEWKLCYRVGRAPLDAAKRFAAAWLKELPTG